MKWTERAAMIAKKSANGVQKNNIVQSVPDLIVMSGMSMAHSTGNPHNHELMRLASNIWAYIALIGLCDNSEVLVLNGINIDKVKDVIDNEGMDALKAYAIADISKHIDAVFNIANDMREMDDWLVHNNAPVEQALLCTLMWGAPLKYAIRFAKTNKEWSGDDDATIMHMAFAVARTMSERQEKVSGNGSVLDLMFRLSGFPYVLEVLHEVYSEVYDEFEYFIVIDEFLLYPDFCEELKTLKASEKNHVKRGSHF